VVLEGEADVTVGGVFLGVVGPGETVGELSSFNDAARSAEVTARTSMLVASLPASSFDSLLDVAPSISKALLRQMAARLLRATLVASRSRPPEPVVTETSQPWPAGQPLPDASAVELFSPAFFQFPYAAYAAVREQGPAVFNELVESWIVTRYSDVAHVLRDKNFSSELDNASTNVFVEATRAANKDLGDPQTVGRFDGADHVRIRRLLSSAFTPRAMQQLRSGVVGIAEDLLARAAEAGECDFVEHVALPLPSKVISQMLGLPEADIDMLHEWSLAASLVPEPLATPEENAKTKSAIQALRSYMLDQAESRRRHPTNDVLSALAHAHHDGQRLSRAELADNAGLLYIAGHITTVNLLASMMAMFQDNRDQLALVMSDPALQANAVEEVLRLEPPAQFGRRYALSNTTIDGVPIPAGASIITSMGAANRDPRRWGADADAFKVDRLGAHQHLAFAGGAHFCAGAALARMEGQIVLDLIMRRYPNFVVTSTERKWGQRLVLRGLEALPIRLAGSGAS
jgi:cytochrome P450